MNILDARLEGMAGMAGGSGSGDGDDGGSMRNAHDDEQSWTPPDSWLLADALDRVALGMGWRRSTRGTAEDRVEVSYTRPPKGRPVEDASGGF